MASRKPAEPPYWLIDFEEYCDGCAAPYAYAVEARCAGCDRAYCAVCFVTSNGEVFCSECDGGAR